MEMTEGNFKMSVMVHHGRQTKPKPKTKLSKFCYLHKMTVCECKKFTSIFYYSLYILKLKLRGIK